MKPGKQQILLVLTLAFAFLAALTLPVILIGSGSSSDVEQKLSITYGIGVKGEARVKESILYNTTRIVLSNNTVVPARLLEEIHVSFSPEDSSLVRIVSAETRKVLVVGRFSIGLGGSNTTSSSSGAMETLNISMIRGILEEIKKDAGISPTKHSIIVTYTAQYIAEKPGYRPVAGTVTARLIVDYDIAENLYHVRVDKASQKIVLVKLEDTKQQEPILLDFQRLALPLFLLSVSLSPITAYAYRREKMQENPYKTLRARYADIILDVDAIPQNRDIVIVKDPWRLASLAEKTGTPLLAIDDGEQPLLCIVQENISLCAKLAGDKEAS